jgi:hypothetical protein
MNSLILPVYLHNCFRTFSGPNSDRLGRG